MPIRPVANLNCNELDTILKDPNIKRPIYVDVSDELTNRKKSKLRQLALYYREFKGTTHLNVRILPDVDPKVISIDNILNGTYTTYEQDIEIRNQIRTADAERNNDPKPLFPENRTMKNGKFNHSKIRKVKWYAMILPFFSEFWYILKCRIQGIYPYIEYEPLEEKIDSGTITWDELELYSSESYVEPNRIRIR